MAHDEHFDAFISFAEPDRVLAAHLKDLLEALGLSCFFAREKIPINAPAYWQRYILEAGLKRSTCFVPIYSQHSLKRPWVLFEAGAAAAQKLTFVATKVKAIDDSEIRSLPFGGHLNFYNLYQDESLKHLATAIYRATLIKAGIKKPIKEIDIFEFKLKAIFDQQCALVHELRCKANVRWVFLAGNLPHGFLQIDELHEFIHDLTMGLLKEGFNICACPQVNHVGKIALETAHAYIDEGSSCSIDGCALNYAFGGLFPIDRELRHVNLGTDEVKEKWRQHLLAFRESYLEDKEWVIFVGGNEGTGEEFEAIERINRRRSPGIKTCFVTDFGGSSETLFNASRTSKHESLYIKGNVSMPNGTPPAILAKTVVERVNNYRLS